MVRFFGSVVLGACLVSACGGMSQHTEADDDSGDEPQGGIGGTSTGGTSTGGAPSGGALSVGGSAPAGGASAGGTGGVITPTCPDCPAANYGVVVDGFGEVHELAYNGFVALAEAPTICPEQPVRGAVGGCVRTVSFSVCAGPASRPPCLEVNGAVAYYADESGRPWQGTVSSDVLTPAEPGVASGTLTLGFTGDDNASFLVTVRYAICAQLGNIKIVC